MNYDWADIMLKRRNSSRSFVEEGGEIITRFRRKLGRIEEERGASHEYSGRRSGDRQKVKRFDRSCRRREMDGGKHRIQSLVGPGTVVQYAGRLTADAFDSYHFKAGIEGMLKRMIGSEGSGGGNGVNVGGRIVKRPTHNPGGDLPDHCK